MKKNKYIPILASGLFIIIAGVFYSCSYKENQGQEILLISQENDSKQKDNQSNTNQNNDQDNADQTLWIQLDSVEEHIYVHLCGAVVKPDVYEVESGSRLKDLIVLAGGLTSDAAGDYINQASLVEDGQRIYIPTKDELKDLSLSDYISGDGDEGNDERGSKVNINKADEAELMTLTGIGEAKAKSIVEYRKKNGEFKDIRDLMNVPGIKEGLFAQIEDEITLGKTP
ncbi:MAG: hypothetical protein GX237_00245 [Clostridiales bacterium]|nr:hypothetical protein [Clostridiales bacterium]